MGSEKSKEEIIIDDLLSSLGEWAEEIVIGGGYALLIYRFYLSAEREPMPAATRDIDSLIPRSIGNRKIKLANFLREAGFQHQFKDGENPPTESYVKEIEGEEVELEFLTDDRVRKNRGANVKISGVTAQALSYLEMSLKEIKTFKTQSHQGKVVSPAAWAFHKALTFPRRREDAKQKKDLYGIWFVLTQLGATSQEAIEDLKGLLETHSAWAKTAKINLSKLKDWTQGDWQNLEAQDPSGGITRQKMQNAITKFGIIP